MIAVNRRSFGLALAALAAIWMIASTSVTQSYAYDVPPPGHQVPVEIAVP